ncbi:F-box protein [Phanerochaete sordida]|uniref:F-box protein n=1 Tax=Phanerochaete sordida TaxID=48140 RepID=A0A9P3G9X1_9APHY|nr:F-box protein [Phanerochaete sordida]
MLGMPLDVIFEVLSYLEPLDLLHLARTNKEFRAMLMARRNAALWRAAWRNVDGLPECPEGVAHPAVANLVFCSRCYECGTVNTKWIFWDKWVRCCKRCQDAILGGKFKSKTFSPRLSIGNGLPIELSPAVRGLKCYQVFPTWIDPAYGGEPKDGSVLYTDMKELNAKLEDMTVDARSAYLAERTVLLERWRESATAFKGWFAIKRVDRYWELVHLRDARHASILEQLKEAGWYDEYMLLSCSDKAEFQALPVVRQARALTERTWRTIAPTIIGLLEKAKELRLHEEHIIRLRTRLTAFSEALPKLYTYRPGEPSDIDIAIGVPELRQIIDSPASQQVDASSFDFLRDDGILAAFAERWKEDCRSSIARRITEQVPGIDPDTDPLSLAVAAGFTCRKCVTLNAPCDPLVHRCDMDHHCWGPPTLAGDTYNVIAAETLTGLFWNPRTFFKTLSILTVIKKCGFDPARATIDQLNESPVRLACNACIREASGFAIMTWFAAYRHCCFAPCQASNLIVADEAMVAAVSEAELDHADAIRADSENDTRPVNCSRCPQGRIWRGEKPELARHFELLHDDDDEQDYWYATQTTRYSKYRDAFVYLLSKEHENHPDTDFRIISREKHAPLVFTDALDASVEI